MNRILAKRYAFCDFSSIAGFPNQVPAKDEWENRERGEKLIFLGDDIDLLFDDRQGVDTYWL